METQFDNEPIDYIDPDNFYSCSPYCTARGFTLLMKWCLIYHKDPTIIDRITDYVEKHPESLNQKNSRGWTALILSARNSQTVSSDSIVSLLIEAGADINAQCEQGWTALMTACKNSNHDSAVSTIQILLEGGANPNIISNDDGSVLHIIRSNGINNYAVILEMLFKAEGIRIDPNIKNHRGNTSLYYIDDNYSIDIYQILINNGTDVNSQNHNGETALMNYIERDGINLDIILLFLDAGSNVTIKDNEGKTVLDYTSGEIKEFIKNYESFPTVKEPDYY